MSSDVLMPQLGETVAEGKILTWFKKEGDEIKEGDKIFEIETDKVTMEVQSTVAGKLSDIRIKAGESAKVGAVVAIIRKAAQPQDQGSAKPAAPPAASKSTLPAAVMRSPFEEVMTPTQSYGPAKGPLGLAMTPLARRLIAQNGLDPDSIARSVHANGRFKIAERDVRAALNGAEVTELLSPKLPISSSTAPAPTGYPGRTVFTLNTIRKRTGERLTQNWQTIPHVFQAIEVDFTKLDRVRSARKESFKAQNGFSLTYLPFIARATCIALKEFPQINAQFGQDGLALAPEVNLGIAIDLSHNGLVVPVIRNADDMTLPGLVKAIGRQIDKARQGTLTSDDFAGGTYSISNNGAFGTTFTAPIINAPQVAILSADAIRLRPAVIETPQGPFVAPRLMGMVGQSFDHRAFDGAYSAAFLSRLRVILEERDWAAEFA